MLTEQQREVGINFLVLEKAYFAWAAHFLSTGGREWGAKVRVWQEPLPHAEHAVPP